MYISLHRKTNLFKNKEIMRVKEVLLTNNLVRLEIEPTCSFERNIPTHVVDDIMRDVIRRKNNTCNCGTSWQRPCVATPPPAPRREPDGIDIHVDRPLRENFSSHIAWCDAMAKYRTLEHVAKDCNWPCREPMKGVQQSQPLHRPQQSPRPVFARVITETPRPRFFGMSDNDIFEDDIFSW